MNLVYILVAEEAPHAQLAKPLHGEEGSKEGRCLIKISLNTQRCNLTSLLHFSFREINRGPPYLRQNPSNSNTRLCVVVKRNATTERILTLFPFSFSFFSLIFHYTATLITRPQLTRRPGRGPAISSTRVTSNGWKARGRGEEESFLSHAIRSTPLVNSASVRLIGCAHPKWAWSPAEGCTMYFKRMQSWRLAARFMP